MAFLSIGGKSPLPQTGITGHPNAGVSIRLVGARSPFGQFNPATAVNTVWSNPLVLVPIKPLPLSGAGGTFGQAGYAQ